jgi:hypothetical protein
MVLRSAVHNVWFAGLILQTVLAAVLVAKKTWGKLPFFTAYSIFDLLETGVSYAVFSNHRVYFYTYCVGETILVLLELALVCEIFVQLFSLYPGLRKLAWLSFSAAVILLVILGGAVINGSGTPIGKHGVGIALLVVEEAARILEVGLIAFLFVFSTVLGLHWRQSVFGIALGLGLWTVVKLVVVTVVRYMGPTAGQSWNLALVIAFDFCLLIWLGYLLAPERVTSVAELPKRAQLEQWNQAIMELINQ